jgi:hypothetical protein
VPAATIARAVVGSSFFSSVVEADSSSGIDVVLVVVGRVVLVVLVLVVVELLVEVVVARARVVGVGA